MRLAQRFILLGGLAACILGLVGAFALGVGAASTPPENVPGGFIWTQAARVFPWRLALWYALPALFTGLGATSVALFRRHRRARFIGENFLILGASAAFIGWFDVPQFLSALAVAFMGLTQFTVTGTTSNIAWVAFRFSTILAIAVAGIFIVDEVSQRHEESGGQETVYGE